MSKKDATSQKNTPKSTSIKDPKSQQSKNAEENVDTLIELTKEDIREIKKILAAIDGSRNAERALLLAMKVADRFDAEVEIFTVVPRLILPFYGPGPVGAASNPVWMDEYYKDQENYSKKILSESKEKMKEFYPELNLSTKMGEGDPATMIVKEAKDFDLVVVGKRGHGFVEELIMGSVSKGVVDRSTVPVLVEK